MFQDLEVGSVYVKIIEYSIAGKCFLTDDIWQRILSRKRSSVFKKCIRSFLTFKVLRKTNDTNLSKKQSAYIYL